MINKFLYWFVTVPARNLAMIAGGAVLVLVIAGFALVQSANARTTTEDGTPVAAAATSTPAAVAAGPTATPAAAALDANVKLSEWSFTISRIELRPCVVYRNADGTTRPDNQPHYLFWLDAKNEAAGARSMRRTISWSILTEGDHTYYARLDQDFDTNTTGTWVEAEGRDYQALDVPAGGETRQLVAFRTFRFKPLKLTASTVESSPQTVEFDLTAPGLLPEASTTGC